MEGETRSSLSVADRRRERLTEFYEHGVVIDARRGPVRRRGGGALAVGRWMTVSGSLPPGAPADGYATLRSGVPVAADTVERDRPTPRPGQDERRRGGGS